jgi:hypothetical protein
MDSTQARVTRKPLTALLLLALVLALLLCPLAGAAIFTPECGVEAYENLLMQFAVKYPGTAIWPLGARDIDTTQPAKELTGVYPGTYSATGVTLQSAGPIVSGETAKAAAFTAGYVREIGYSPLTITGACTILFWMKAGLQLSNTNTVFGITNNGNIGPLFGIKAVFTPSKKLAIWWRADSLVWLINSTDSTGEVLDSAWHHIAFTSSNGTCILYIDGVADASNFSFSPSGTFTPNQIVLADYYRIVDQGAYFVGSLAYATVSPAAWTPSEVKAVYDAAVKGL